MSISHQLVRKLLNATSAEQEGHGTQKKDDSNQAKRKRKNRVVDIDEPSVSEQDILAWHTQTLLVADRQMAATSFSKKNSNAAAFHKSLQNLERKQQAKRTRTTESSRHGGTGAARTSTASDAQAMRLPTFNKKRHEEERQQKKLLKLAKALQTMDKIKKTKKTRTIFG